MLENLKRKPGVRLFLEEKGDGVETRTTQTTLCVVPEDISAKVKLHQVEVYAKKLINDAWEVNSAYRMAMDAIQQENVTIFE